MVDYRNINPRYVCGVPSSVTGGTAMTALGVVTIPAALIVPNSRIAISAFFDAKNNANTKTYQISVNEGGAGLASSTYFYNAALGFTGGDNVRAELLVRDQITNLIGGIIASGSGIGTGNVFTPINKLAANGLDIIFAAQLSNSGDWVTLEGYEIEVHIP